MMCVWKKAKEHLLDLLVPTLKGFAAILAFVAAALIFIGYAYALHRTFGYGHWVLGLVVLSPLFLVLSYVIGRLFD